MVVVNLYEFKKVAANKDAPLEELIENIDIGGPTMIRLRRRIGRTWRWWSHRSITTPFWTN